MFPTLRNSLCSSEGFQLNQIPVAHSIEEAVHMAKALRRRPNRDNREMKDILSTSIAKFMQSVLFYFAVP